MVGVTMAASLQTKRPITDWKLLRESDGTNDADWLGDFTTHASLPDMVGSTYASTRDLGVPTKIRAVLVVLDASGDPLDHVGTAKVIPIEMISTDAGDVLIGGAEVDVTVGRTFEFALNGSGGFNVRLHTFASLDGDADSVEVWYRIVRE
jgi:hypothetical protein